MPVDFGAVLNNIHNVDVMDKIAEKLVPSKFSEIETIVATIFASSMEDVDDEDVPIKNHIISFEFLIDDEPKSLDMYVGATYNAPPLPGRPISINEK